MSVRTCRETAGHRILYFRKTSTKAGMKTGTTTSYAGSLIFMFQLISVLRVETNNHPLNYMLPDRSFHSFKGLKICRTTFVNYTSKYVYFWIFRLEICKMFGQVPEKPVAATAVAAACIDDASLQVAGLVSTQYIYQIPDEIFQNFGGSESVARRS